MNIYKGNFVSENTVDSLNSKSKKVNLESNKNILKNTKPVFDNKNRMINSQSERRFNKNIVKESSLISNKKEFGGSSTISR